MKKVTCSLSGLAKIENWFVFLLARRDFYILLGMDKLNVCIDSVEVSAGEQRVQRGDTVMHIATTRRKSAPTSGESVHPLQ